MTTTVEKMVTRTNANATLRCKDCKDCKAAGRISYVMIHTLQAYEGRPISSQMIEVDGRTRTVRDRYDVMRALHSACVCGSGKVDVRIVKGTYIADKTCGPRCMSAMGPTCECSCAGQNHGANLRGWGG